MLAALLDSGHLDLAPNVPLYSFVELVKTLEYPWTTQNSGTTMNYPEFWHNNELPRFLALQWTTENSGTTLNYLEFWHYTELPRILALHWTT